jgi:hypothetical protein
MYGSAGSHSAGSLPLDIFFGQVRAIGQGLGLDSKLAYDYDAEGVGLGSGVGGADFLIMEVTVPIGMGLDVGELITTVAGSISIDLEAIGQGLGVTVGDGQIILEGVPLFTIVRNPTSTEIEVLNREGKDVKIYRSDAYNISYSELTNISSDTFTDTGLEATKNYKYKLAFRIGLTPEIIGQRSTGKYRS